MGMAYCWTRRFTSVTPGAPFARFTPTAMIKPPMTRLVTVSKDGIGRIVELNRPEALHSLNTTMIKAITANLKVWDQDNLCNVVLLTASSLPDSKKKIFCAGGDVVGISFYARIQRRDGIELAKNRGNMAHQCEFFRSEYALNHYLSALGKPVIAFLDGITMGGGVGMSVHGQFRIATEHSVFAMPETAIGFFPDVGSSFFLSRLDGQLGTYLALTGKHLHAQDVYHAGIATHIIPSTRLADVKASLCSGSHSPKAIASLLEHFSADITLVSEADLIVLGSCFEPDSLLQILRRLHDTAKGSNPQTAEWASKTIDTLRSSSPTALAATLALIHKGKTMSFKSCLQMEYNLAKNFVSVWHSVKDWTLCLQKVDDLYEGINAKLISKTGNPRWKPASIEELDQNFINGLFAPNEALKDTLEFHSEMDFMEYPHHQHTLPTTEEIRRLTSQHRDAPSREALIEKICKEQNHKLGLESRLRAVVADHVKTRKELQKDGYVATSNLNWID